jgi:NAD+ synthase (glutamine-hydrolysing)
MLVHHRLSKFLAFSCVLIVLRVLLFPFLCRTSPHASFLSSGVDIISNGSSSYHELKKSASCYNVISSVTKRYGGIYLYSNLRGCDGNRIYFNGNSVIVRNGELVAQASEFSLKDVEVISSEISISSFKSYRKDLLTKDKMSASSSSGGFQYPKIHIPNFSLCPYENDAEEESSVVQPSFVPIEEEVVKSTACYLYDYLRRSHATGFLLSLTGNINSTAVALLVRMMCEMMSKAILTDHNSSVKTFAETIIGKVRTHFLSRLSVFVEFVIFSSSL